MSKLRVWSCFEGEAWVFDMYAENETQALEHAKGHNPYVTSVCVTPEKIRRPDPVGIGLSDIINIIIDVADSIEDPTEPESGSSGQPKESGQDPKRRLSLPER
jgi:hypothetical protein